jgi:hypothetical protein
MSQFIQIEKDRYIFSYIRKREFKSEPNMERDDEKNFFKLVVYSLFL